MVVAVCAPAGAAGTARAIDGGMANTHGSKWIRPSTRLAIYLRDGMACVYCGHAVEEGERLSLDHLVPRVAGGTHAPTNLVTCCSHCNSARQDRSVASWARAVSEYTLEPATAIVARVRRTVRRALPRREALEIMSRR